MSDEHINMWGGCGHATHIAFQIPVQRENAELSPNNYCFVYGTLSVQLWVQLVVVVVCACFCYHSYSGAERAVFCGLDETAQCVFTTSLPSEVGVCVSTEMRRSMFAKH